MLVSICRNIHVTEIVESSACAESLALLLHHLSNDGGRRVAVAARGKFGAGRGELVWNGKDASGRPVAPGVYFLRVQASTGETATTRVSIRR